MKLRSCVIYIFLFMFAVFTFAGCGGNSEEAKLMVDGKPVKVSYVVTIDDKKVSLDEYRYYFLNIKKSYESGDQNVWETENALKMLKLDVLDGIKESYAVWNLAEENGIKITKKDKKTIEENINDQIKTYGGEEKYQEVLKQSYMNEDFYHFLWETSILYEKLNNFYFGEGGEFYNADEASVSHEQELKDIIDSAMKDLKVEFGPEYDLITTETLL